MHEEFRDIQMSKSVMYIGGEVSDSGGYEAQSHAATMILQNTVNRGT